VVVLGGAAVAGYYARRHAPPPAPQLKQEAPAAPSTITFEPYKPSQMLTLANFCGTKHIAYYKDWTHAELAGSGCSISFFTYNAENVTSELKADGRFPTNVTYWHDVGDRHLTTYPFSLDNIYEIQLRLAKRESPPASMQALVDEINTNPFTHDKTPVTDLKLQSISGNREMADYIRKPTTGIPQRIILVYKKDLSEGYTLTINRAQSRTPIDQSDIADLNGFIAGLTF
jgi:hypothetical protein